MPTDTDPKKWFCCQYYQYFQSTLNKNKIKTILISKDSGLTGCLWQINQNAGRFDSLNGFTIALGMIVAKFEG